MVYRLHTKIKIFGLFIKLHFFYTSDKKAASGGFAKRRRFE
jgi:hypothetical protein